MLIYAVGILGRGELIVGGPGDETGAQLGNGGGVERAAGLVFQPLGEFLHRRDAVALGLDGKVKRADADLVREATGFVIGGVPPVAHETKLPIVIDASLARFETVNATAGHPYCVFATSVAELARILIDAIGADVEPQFNPRHVLVSRRAADITRAKEMIGFEYSVPVVEGMTDLIRFETNPETPAR